MMAFFKIFACLRRRKKMDMGRIRKPIEDLNEKKVALDGARLKRDRLQAKVLELEHDLPDIQDVAADAERGRAQAILRLAREEIAPADAQAARDEVEKWAAAAALAEELLRATKDESEKAVRAAIKGGEDAKKAECAVWQGIYEDYRAQAAVAVRDLAITAFAAGIPAYPGTTPDFLFFLSKLLKEPPREELLGAQARLRAEYFGE